MAKRLNDLIHVAEIYSKDGNQYLLLRKINPHAFTWFVEEADGAEKETSVSGPHIEETIRLAAKFWKNDHFRPLGCGFRYTLPERDEHGINALFHQMASSYASSNGIYFDEELGSNCFVQFASTQALAFWKRLSQIEKAS